MLFVSLLTLKPTATLKEALQRRAQWKEPEGIKPIAEYWLLANTPHVISIDDADGIASLMAATAPWTEVFNISVSPAVTAEEGLKLASQIMPKAL